MATYGYKRRSREFVRFIKDRLLFYHIQTALLGNNICDVETMDNLDDMITDAADEIVENDDNLVWVSKGWDRYLGVFYKNECDMVDEIREYVEKAALGFIYNENNELAA